MRADIIPHERLFALERGCPGLLNAIVDAVEHDDIPELEVLRQKPRGEASRWFIQVTSSTRTKVLILDNMNLDAMAAAVPVYLVDLVHDLQDELSEVLAIEGMMDGIAKVIPFILDFKKERPS